MKPLPSDGCDHERRRRAHELGEAWAAETLVIMRAEIEKALRLRPRPRRRRRRRR